MRREFLAFALPDIGPAELAEIKAALDSGWITTGPKTRQFEAEFSAFVRAKYAIALNSCTAALHLALEAVGVQRGDVVLTSPFTFAATAEVIRYFVAIPAFVDVDPETLNLDAVKLAETAERLARGHKHRPTNARSEHPGGRLRAVIPVHIAGLPVDLDGISAVASQYHLSVIEDAAHAFPAKYKGAMIGSVTSQDQPSAACFSFYATKTITTGEGGMVCTDDEALAERCRIMSLHGISRDAWKRYTAEGSWYYEIITPGYKYNMTDVAAAMGLAQLRRAEAMWCRRREIAQMYNTAFGVRSELQLPADSVDCQHAWHLYILRLRLEQLTIDRARFIDELKARNIGASVHFIPLHLHPYYREEYGYSPEDYPVAFKEYQRVVSLPIYSKMTNQDVQDVVEAVLDIVDKFRR